MEQHPLYMDKRRARLINITNKTKHDDFYMKLERIRSSAAASSSKQYPRRTARELLDESKRYFVKSQHVLYNQQTLSNNHRITSTCRILQPRRSPYQEYQYEQNKLRLDLSSPSITRHNTDCAFESVSILSLSDQTTLDSMNSPTHVIRNLVPTPVTIIERNARIIKWLFQLHKTNDSPSFQCIL
ncbi:unnamed protein product [Adineta steineri]|uniref:Centrosome-associated FAM110 C-terminal domain-containing protein n=1 Tax=Adineta steineri TaxID=433720 RepID=A0A814PRG7_9BILA|nr:unnamed protein product [Adineta steineri]CAF3629034.1 unnamed protein product [Adineta steineri]